MNNECAIGNSQDIQTWAAQGQYFMGSNNFLSLLQIFLGEAVVRIKKYLIR
jgi:hypothetical protein